MSHWPRRPSPSYEPAATKSITSLAPENPHFAKRRQTRLASSLTIWPPSPPPPSSRPLPAPEKRRKREKDSHKDKKRKKEKRKDEVWVERKVEVSTPKVVEQEVDDEIGPVPAPVVEEKIDEREYGEQMLRGEGSAMAIFAAQGIRIPRRGEIGMEPIQIENFEMLGYVMSGSRNKKMDSVRIRKENQVYSAEERRSLLKLQKEEKMKRESAIISSFKELIDSRLADAKKD